MTSKEFVIWLKGFVEGSNNYNLTPAAWDVLKDKLKEVKDDRLPPVPFGVPNVTPITKQYVPKKSPYEPPYYVGDPPDWMNPFTTTGTNKDLYFTATNGQTGSI